MPRKGSRANGTSPRQRGTNPRAQGAQEAPQPAKPKPQKRQDWSQLKAEARKALRRNAIALEAPTD